VPELARSDLCCLCIQFAFFICSERGGLSESLRVQSAQRERVESAQQRHAAAEQALADFKRKMGSHEAVIEASRARVDNARVAEENAQEQVNHQRATIAKIDSEVAACKSRHAERQSELAQAKKARPQLEGDVALLGRQRAEIQTKVDDKSRALAGLKQQLQMVVTYLDELNKLLSIGQSRPRPVHCLASLTHAWHLMMRLAGGRVVSMKEVIAEKSQDLGTRSLLARACLHALLA
jgi:hypothetical protein